MAIAYDPAATLAASYTAENALAQRVLQLPPTYDGLSGVPFTPPILPIARLLSSSTPPPDAALSGNLVALDHELQTLFSVLLQRLVLPWHRPLTPERGLCQEAHVLVAQLAARIADRFPPLLQGNGDSWDQLRILIVAEAPSLFQTHWATYRALPPADRARLGHLDLLTRPHPGVCLSGRSETTLNPLYIRSLVEELLRSLLEKDEEQSDIALYLLRDILSSALLLGLKGAHPRFWSGALHSALDALQSLLNTSIMVHRPRKSRRIIGIPGSFVFLTSLFGWIALAGQLIIWLMFFPILVPSRFESSAAMPGTFPRAKTRFSPARRRAPQNAPTTPPHRPESGEALVAYVTAVDDLLDLRRTVLGSLVSLIVRVVMALSASNLENWIITQLQRVLTLPQVTSLLRAIRTAALPMDLEDLPPGFPDPVRSPEVLAQAAERRSWSTLPQHAADTLFSLFIFGVCVGHTHVPFHPLPSKLWVAAEVYTATGGKAYSYPVFSMEGKPQYIPPAAANGPNWHPPRWLTRFHQAVMTGARHALAPLCASDATPLDTRLALSLTERVAAVLDPQLLRSTTYQDKKGDGKLSSSLELPLPPVKTLTLRKKSSKSRRPSSPSSSPHLPVLQLQGRKATPPTTSLAAGGAPTPQTQLGTFTFPEAPMAHSHAMLAATDGLEPAASYNLSPSMHFPVPANAPEKGPRLDGEERPRSDGHRVPHLTRTFSGGILGLEGIPETAPHSPALSAGTSNGTFGERAFRPGHFSTQSLTALATPPIVASAAATANLSSTSLVGSARKDLQRHSSGSSAPASSTPPKRLQFLGTRSASPPAAFLQSSTLHKKHKSASSTFSLGFL